MFFISKTMNNGYGETVKGFDTIEVSNETIKNVWVENDEDVMEESGFNWNVESVEEGKELFSQLCEKGIVCREYEDSIVCVSRDYTNGIEYVLKQV